MALTPGWVLLFFVSVSPPAFSLGPVSLAECAIAVGGSPTDSLVSQLRDVDQTLSDPRAFWNGWNRAEESRTESDLTEAEYTLYLSEFQRYAAKTKGLIKEPMHALDLVIVGHARAWESLGNGRLREFKTNLKKLGPEHPTTQQSRLAALRAFQRVLSEADQGNLKYMGDKFRAELTAHFARAAERCFELTGTQVRKRRVAIQGNFEHTSWEILPTPGSDWNTAAVTLSGMNPAHSLVYAAAIEFEKKPVHISHDARIVFLNHEQLLKFDLKLFLQSVRIAVRSNRSVTSTRSGLDLRYIHLPTAESALGSHTIQACNTLSKSAAAMPEDIGTMFATGGRGFLEDFLKEAATAKTVSLFGRTVEQDLLNALGEMSALVTHGKFLIHAFQDRTGSFGLISSEPDRSVLRWSLTIKPSAGDEPGTLTFSSRRMRLLVPLKSPRMLMLAQRWASERPTERIVSGGNVEWEVKELAWELLALARRQNDVTVAVNEYAALRLEDSMAALKLFLEAPSPESLQYFRQSLLELELPSLTNSTVRNLPQRLRSEKLPQPNDFALPLTPQTWEPGHVPFAHLTHELETAKKEGRNHAVERIGMVQLAQLLQRAGWYWKDVSADNVGYDLLAKDPNSSAELHIELKARSELQDTIQLSVNEMRFAALNPKTAVLAIVWVDKLGQTRTALVQDFIAPNSLSPAEVSRVLSIERLLETARVGALPRLSRGISP